MILLPVLALGAVGLWQLQKDRAAALAEAREEAEAVLVEVLEEEVSFASTFPYPFGFDGSVKMITEGARSTPTPIPPVPVPPADGLASPSFIQLMEIMDAENLSPKEKAEALFELVERNRGKQSFDRAITAAGFSVKQLAMRNALRFGSEAGLNRYRLRNLARDFAQEVIYRPSILTEQFVEEARRYIIDPETDRRWGTNIRQWDREQRSRKFIRENQPELDRLRAQLPQLEFGIEPNVDSRMDRVRPLVLLPSRTLSGRVDDVRPPAGRYRGVGSFLARD